ncbi:hypothetical protein DERP_000753 [Dermatophagoides pteronyssinus]|uniref:Uncharacterized protein n=1 Tax=Dermatophagoides pteronyssinus TaxID=6956 RepID=A0ABQ8J118_DERPT|nr:hypothetical protein DERP_000753 [Dermatophagoides pteronyssinus]
MMMAESRISLPKQQPKQQHSKYFNYRKNCQLLIPSSSSSPSLNFKNYHSIDDDNDDDDDDDDDDENFKTKLKISTKNITKSSSLNDNILLTRIQMTNSLMNNDVDDGDEQQKQQQKQQQLSPEEYEQISKLLLLHFRDGRPNSTTIDTIGQQQQSQQYLEDDPHTWPSNWQSQAPKMILTPDLYLKEKPTLNEYQKNLIYRISNKYEPLKYYYLQMINQQQQQQKLKNHNNSVENDDNLPLNSFESINEQPKRAENKSHPLAKSFSYGFLDSGQTKQKNKNKNKNNKQMLQNLKIMYHVPKSFFSIQFDSI